MSSYCIGRRRFAVGLGCFGHPSFGLPVADGLLMGLSGPDAPFFSGSYSDTGKRVVSNFGGLILYYYANSLKYYAAEISRYSEAELSVLSNFDVLYLRLPWCELEPTEGGFNWALLDRPIQLFASLGLRFGLRLTASENSIETPFATPRWVFDRGARYVTFPAGHPLFRAKGGTGQNVEPRFDDPTFLFYYRRLIKEVALRYGAHRLFDFIDVGSFGVYGEMHTVSSSGVEYSAEVVSSHVAMFEEFYARDKILVNHNAADHAPSSGRNIDLVKKFGAQGFGFRDDSLLVNGGSRAFYDDEMALSFSGRVPVVLETAEYSTAVRRGTWMNSKVLEAIRAYRASHLGFYWSPLRFYQAEKSLFLEVRRILGFRLVFQSLSLFVRGPNAVALYLTIANNGVRDLIDDIEVSFFSSFSEGGKALLHRAVVKAGSLFAGGHYSFHFVVPCSKNDALSYLGGMSVSFRRLGSDFVLEFPHSLVDFDR